MTNYSQESLNEAAATFIHYFRQAGIEVSGDMAREIRAAVQHIYNAATYDAVLEAKDKP